MCLNRKALAVVGVVALGVLAFAPRTFATALPLLLLAACPLSMVFMMRTMGATKQNLSAAEIETVAPSGATPAGKSVEGQLAELRYEIDGLRSELRVRDLNQRP